MQEHQGLTQRAHVEETFHTFAQVVGDDSSSSEVVNENALTEDMAFAATKDVLESWGLPLSDELEQKFKETHFEPTWNKYAKIGATAGNFYL